MHLTHKMLNIVSYIKIQSLKDKSVISSLDVSVNCSTVYFVNRNIGGFTYSLYDVYAKR